MLKYALKGAIIIKVFYVTNIGAVKKDNQDSILVNDSIINTTSFQTLINSEKKADLFAVADGMGGYHYGHVASKRALEFLYENKDKITNIEETSKVLKGIQNSFAKLDEKYEGMGTVLTGLNFRDDKIILFNVGDSRVYRFRDDNLEVLSRDHSLVYEYYLDGKISFEDMRTHKENGRVRSSYRVLDRELGLYQVEELDYIPGDKYLICSDGLWEMISHEQIEALMKNEEYQSLLDLAIKNGGNDNISYIIIE